MCDQCEQSRGEKSNPSWLTRRAFLGFGAVAVGVAISQISCQPQGKIRGEKKPVPATASEPATKSAPSEPATTKSAETHPATTTTTAVSQPTPDLGNALFPDAAGNPVATAADCPVMVIPRSTWTAARPHLNDIRPMNGVSRMTVHHTGWNLNTDAWKPTAVDLENIRNFHAGTKVTDRQWADIAYHFVVDRAGRVWQARPLAYQGAHAKEHNEHNLGICLLGNFEVQMPTAAQLWSLNAFINFLRDVYRLPVGEVYTHRELRQTECPGKHLQAYMDRARRAWAKKT